MAHRPSHKGLDFSAIKTYPRMKRGWAVILGMGTYPQGKTSFADLTDPGGVGYEITGHHEILFPLLCAVVRDRLG